MYELLGLFSSTKQTNKPIPTRKEVESPMKVINAQLCKNKLSRLVNIEIYIFLCKTHFQFFLQVKRIQQPKACILHHPYTLIWLSRHNFLFPCAH